MARLTPGWETFDHIADIGIRGVGVRLEEAFENGAMALFSLMVEDIAAITPRQDMDLECDSFDLVGLFVAWINDLIALSDLRGMVFNKFKVEIKELSLTAQVFGEKWSPEKHGRGIEVKGATFSQARVEKRNGLWIAQCVVDV